jgi:hypothetical protein
MKQVLRAATRRERELIRKRMDPRLRGNDKGECFFRVIPNSIWNPERLAVEVQFSKHPWIPACAGMTQKQNDIETARNMGETPYSSGFRTMPVASFG